MPINMRILLFFAVDRHNKILYLYDKPYNHPAKFFPNQSSLEDMLNDMDDLEHELDWSKLDEEYKPDTVGMYQAIIEYEQTAEDDYTLYVTHCTPVSILFKKENENEQN